MELNFNKDNGLIPAVAQDSRTGKVLMLGFMNKEAYEKTLETGLATFYSRSRGELWTKGETSGNYLHIKEIVEDCDKDTLLLKVEPAGPVCHTGQDTCFGEDNKVGLGFLTHLAAVIKDRKQHPADGSYTSSLFEKGTSKVAQKVGEEAVEMVIDALGDDREGFLNEAADLLYHYLVLLEAKGVDISDVIDILESRHK